MPDLNSRVYEISKLREQKRFDEALSLLEELFAEFERESEPSRSRHVILMMEFQALALAYAPAHRALSGIRAEQAARVLAGDLYRGAGDGKEDSFPPFTRFSLVADIGRLLGETRPTYELFVRLDAAQPTLAQHYAGLALPAIVEAGDFGLADRYRGDPLGMLDEVNHNARSMPLFPRSGEAPRVAAELMNLINDVQLAMAVLCGQGKEAQGAALRGALLGGLESADVRALAQRELEDPGTINRELTALAMARQSG